jgi:hypothetical protein
MRLAPEALAREFCEIGVKAATAVDHHAGDRDGADRLLEVVRVRVTALREGNHHQRVTSSRRFSTS